MLVPDGIYAGEIGLASVTYADNEFTQNLSMS
jgi:hypothetical protein